MTKTKNTFIVCYVTQYKLLQRSKSIMVYCIFHFFHKNTRSTPVGYLRCRLLCQRVIESETCKDI